MEPHIDVITVAVGEFDRLLVFYRDGRGLETPGARPGTEILRDETTAAPCAY